MKLNEFTEPMFEFAIGVIFVLGIIALGIILKFIGIIYKQWK